MIRRRTGRSGRPGSPRRARKAEEGVGKARQAGEALDAIVSGAAEVTALIDEIAQTAVRQQSGVRQVEESIGRISGLIADISSAARDGAERSANLAGATQSLHASIGAFRVE